MPGPDSKRLPADYTLFGDAEVRLRRGSGIREEIQIDTKIARACAEVRTELGNVRHELRDEFRKEIGDVRDEKRGGRIGRPERVTGALPLSGTPRP